MNHHKHISGSCGATWLESSGDVAACWAESDSASRQKGNIMSHMWGIGIKWGAALICSQIVNVLLQSKLSQGKILINVVFSLTLNDAIQKSSLYWFEFVDSPNPSFLAPSLPDSWALSCRLQQSEGHVCFLSQPIPLLLSPVMSSGEPTRSYGRDT